jgi:hypothetical protein
MVVRVEMATKWKHDDVDDGHDDDYKDDDGDSNAHQGCSSQRSDAGQRACTARSCATMGCFYVVTFCTKSM